MKYLKRVFVLLAFSLNAFAHLPEKVTFETFEEILSQEEGNIVLVVGSATCGSCKQFEPELIKVTEEIGKEFRFYAGDITESPAFIEQYQVKTTPTFLLFKDGHFINRGAGNAPKDRVVEFIKNSFKRAETPKISNLPENIVVSESELPEVTLAGDTTFWLPGVGTAIYSEREGKGQITSFFGSMGIEKPPTDVVRKVFHMTLKSIFELAKNKGIKELVWNLDLLSNTFEGNEGPFSPHEIQEKIEELSAKKEIRARFSDDITELNAMVLALQDVSLFPEELEAYRKAAIPYYEAQAQNLREQSIRLAQAAAPYKFSAPRIRNQADLIAYRMERLKTAKLFNLNEIEKLARGQVQAEAKKLGLIQKGKLYARALACRIGLGGKRSETP